MHSDWLLPPIRCYVGCVPLALANSQHCEQRCVMGACGALQDAVAREMFIAEELMSGLRGQLDRMRHDTITEVGDGCTFEGGSLETWKATGLVGSLRLQSSVAYQPRDVLFTATNFAVCTPTKLLSPLPSFSDPVTFVASSSCATACSWLSTSCVCNQVCRLYNVSLAGGWSTRPAASHGPRPSITRSHIHNHGRWPPRPTSTSSSPQGSVNTNRGATRIQLGNLHPVIAP